MLTFGLLLEMFETRHESEGDAEATRDVLERMPYFLQDLDAPTDHILTT